MPVTQSLSADRTYVLVTIIGTLTLPIAEATISNSAALAASAGVTKVLVDALEQDQPLDTFSAHHVGLALSAPALRSLSIAIVIPDPLDVPHHIETVASNRGRRVHYFNDIDTALVWLGVVNDGHQD
jgi:hypothetical protein